MLWKALKGQIRSDSQFIITGLILLVVLIGGPFLWSQWGTEPKFDVFRSVVLNVGLPSCPPSPCLPRET